MDYNTKTYNMGWDNQKPVSFSDIKFPCTFSWLQSYNAVFHSPLLLQNVEILQLSWTTRSTKYPAFKESFHYSVAKSSFLFSDLIFL